MMSTALRIGIGLFILGIIGVFYVADSFFERFSGSWYSAIVIFLVIAVVGVGLLWKEWGFKSSKHGKSSKSGGKGKRRGQGRGRR